MLFSIAALILLGMSPILGRHLGSGIDRLLAGTGHVGALPLAAGGPLRAAARARRRGGRTTGLNAAVGRLWQMLEDAPETMPRLMRVTAGVAPAFSTGYPEGAVIFDKLHVMHDVTSDILASPEVPRYRMRAEILRARELLRSDTA